MKKFIFILIICFPNNLFSDSLQIKIKDNVLNPVGQFLINPAVITLFDYISISGYSFYNAKSDAGVFQRLSGINGGKTYVKSANLEEFHFNKNMANLFLVLKGYSVSMSVKHCIDGRMKWKTFITREICQLFLANFIWHMTYNYSRYGDAWTVLPQYNSSRYVIPIPGNEIKIALSGNQVKIANSVELIVGIVPLFSFDFPLNFLEKK